MKAIELGMQIYKEHVKGPESFTATPFRDYKVLAVRKACCMCVWGVRGRCVGRRMGSFSYEACLVKPL